MEPIRTAIAGIGRAGWSMHCSELEGRRDKFTIVAACDSIPERLDKMKDRYGCAAYGDIGEMVKDAEIELVSVATRSAEHTPHAKTALEAGKFVFIEKPIAVSLQQADELEAAAGKHPGKLFCRHNRRFEPAFQHIREIIAEGLIGEVFEVKLRRNGYKRRGDWQTIIGCSGGHLNNWGPHIIDHALQLLESPVASMWSDLKNIAALGDAEDHLKIVLKGENGRVVDLEISGGAALSEPAYLILGDRGALRSDEKAITLRYLDPETALADLEADPGTPPMEGGFGSSEELKWIEKTIDVAPKASCKMDDIWDHLYAAIRLGRPFPVTLEEALEVARVACRARENTEFA